MAAAALHSRDEALAGGLAFAMHVLFLVLLVFGVSWQHKQVDTATVVDLWRDLPSVTPPKVDAPPPPPPAVKSEPPKPVPKAEVKPPPKPEPAPVAKPDIALKEKQEKERRLKEQQAAEEKKKLAAEKAREAELEKKKRAEAEALKLKQAAEADAKRVAAEQQKARDALAAQQAAAQAKAVDEYKRRISDKIRRFIVLPPNVADNAQVEFEIRVLPGGEVLGARLKRAANSIPAYDAAVERAILRAQPLPIPSDPALMSQFRELNLVFRPKD